MELSNLNYLEVSYTQMHLLWSILCHLALQNPNCITRLDHYQVVPSSSICKSSLLSVWSLQQKGKQSIKYSLFFFISPRIYKYFTVLSKSYLKSVRPWCFHRNAKFRASTIRTAFSFSVNILSLNSNAI